MRPHSARAFVVAVAIVLAVNLLLPRVAAASPSDDEIPGLPGVRADFPPPNAVEYGRTGIIPFVDGGPVLYLRSVGYADSPGEAEGTFSPHIYLGVGLWVGEPHGFGEGTPDIFSDFGRPFGIRVGVTWGGKFEFRNKSIDLSVDDASDFSNFEFEFEVMSPWWTWGVGPDLIFSEWEFVGINDRDLDFRSQTITAGTEIKQSISQYAVGVPIQLFDNWNLTLFEKDVPTLFGLFVKYAFLELGVVTQSPAIDGTVSSHVFTAGAWVDWGVARFLRVHLRIAAGGIAGYLSNFVGELKGGVTFKHIPEHWLDGHVELLAKFDVELITHGFGDRYLHETGNARIGRSTVAWLKLNFRLGLRVWF